MIRITSVCKLFVSALPLLIFMMIGLYTTIKPVRYGLDVSFGKMGGALYVGDGNFAILFISKTFSPWSISAPEFQKIDLVSLGNKSLSEYTKRRLFFGANMPSYHNLFAVPRIDIPYWFCYGVSLIFLFWQGRLIFNRKLSEEAQVP